MAIKSRGHEWVPKSEGTWTSTQFAAGVWLKLQSGEWTDKDVRHPNPYGMLVKRFAGEWEIRCPNTGTVWGVREGYWILICNESGSIKVYPTERDVLRRFDRLD